MLRRSFLSGLFLSPVAVAAVASAESAPGGLVFSVREGEHGYVEWCKLNGDGKIVKVWLDDVEQKCTAVDQRRGMVRRPVITASGNFAHDHGKILEEEVFGDVRIEIVPRAPYKSTPTIL